MKNFLIVLCLLFSASTYLSSQEILTESYNMPQAKFFIGASTAINGYSGLFGIDFEPVLTDQLAVRLTAGLGGWGFKLGGGLNYYFDRPNKGSSLSLGFSTAGGSAGLVVDLEMETTNLGTASVPMILDRANTINLLYDYNITLGKKGKLVFGIGYAIPLQSGVYRIQNNAILDDLSERLMKLSEPGGLMTNIRIAFGI